MDITSWGACLGQGNTPAIRPGGYLRGAAVGQAQWSLSTRLTPISATPSWPTQTEAHPALDFGASAHASASPRDSSVTLRQPAASLADSSAPRGRHTPTPGQRAEGRPARQDSGPQRRFPVAVDSNLTAHAPQQRIWCRAAAE